MNRRSNESELSTDETETIIYLGSRNEDFKNFIYSLCKKGKLVPKYLDFLTNEESLCQYSKAFTASSADQVNNYEIFEQLGDTTANKFLVWYFNRRFPFLNNADGVKVIARLRINYGARASFQSIAKSLGFWDFISASEEDRSRNMKKLLEDVFEAFVGVTEYLLDNHFREGVGYAIVYTILKSIFDNMNISLKYEDLFDAKTRLKELCDMYKTQLTNLNYKYEKDIQTNLVTSTVFLNNIEIASGTASLKIDAEQRAAKTAIIILNKKGFVKQIPHIYSTFRDM
jgi:dsRNA-specific ribonuclease